MKHIRWIWGFWQPERRWLWVLLVLTLLSSAVALAFPQVLRYLIKAIEDMVEQGNPELAAETTWKYVGIIAVVGLARSMSSLYPGFRAMINARIEVSVRQRYFSEIIGKGYRFFSKFRTGDLVTRLTDDIGGFPKIAWFCCSGIFRAVESSSKFLFCIAFMLLMNWQLALLTITPLPVMLIVFYFLRTALTKRSLERQRIISTTNDALESAFSGIRILKAFRGEANQSSEFRSILDRRIVIEVGLMKLWMGMHNLYTGIQFAGQIIVVVAGGLMVIRGTIDIGDLYAFFVYVGLMLPPLMDIPNLFVTSRTAFACIDREIEIEETPGGTEGTYAGKKPVERIDSVEARSVGFCYGDDKEPVLKDINFTLHRGERAAIVGTVGCGKTTLIKMVAGLLPPEEGQVLVNGRPLGECSIGDYRARVGYVSQEAMLFSESVEDNVSLGRKCTHSDIRDALSLAQVREEMENLPSGIEQELGQKGLSISGGQKQRLAIARALACKPDLLLMDDCTSALDAENERAFWESFSRGNPDAACLIITHRLSTARKADVIYVLAKGRIVGRGTHDELLRSCDEYRSFLTREELKAALGITGRPAV